MSHLAIVSVASSSRTLLRALSVLSVILLFPIQASATWGWGSSSWSSGSSDSCRNDSGSQSKKSYGKKKYGSQGDSKHSSECYRDCGGGYYQNTCNDDWYYHSERNQCWYKYSDWSCSWDYHCGDGEFDGEEDACESTYADTCLEDQGDDLFYDSCEDEWYYYSERYECWYIYENRCWKYFGDAEFFEECYEVANTAPVAYPVSTTTDYQTSVEITLSGDDSDGDALSFEIVTEPSNGTVSLIDGIVTYTPDAGYWGTDSFTYLANDGALDSEPALVTIIVPEPNLPPAGLDLVYEIVSGSVLTDTFQGSDPNGDPIEFTLVDAPSYGTVSYLGDGVFEYIPLPGFEGEDSFSYIVSDGVLTSAVSTVSIVVICPVGGARGEGVFWTWNPSQINGTVEGSVRHLTGNGFNFNSGGVITGDILTPGTPNVRFNGSPDFGDIVEGDGSSQPSGYWVHINNGSSMNDLVIKTDGEPLPTVVDPTSPTGWENWTINSPSSTRPSDFSRVRNLNINSNGGNVDVPPGAYGNFVANKNTSFTLGVEGATEAAIYSFENFQWNSKARINVVGPVIIRTRNQVQANGPAGNSEHSEWMVWQISQGGFVANSTSETIYAHVYAPNGRVTVNNKAVLCGETYSKDLTVNSGGLLTFCGAPVDDCGNTPPVASDDAGETPKNTPIDFSLQAIDPDGDAILFLLVDAPAHGTVELVDGIVTYTPAAGYAGTDSFTFLASDGLLDSNLGTIVVTVVNTPPVAFDESVTVAKNSSVEIPLSATDADADTLVLSIFGQPSNGTVSIVDGVALYTPNAGFSGEDSFTFVANDGDDLSAPATVTVTIPNLLPSAEDLAATTSKNVSVDVTLEGSDPDGDTLTYALVSSPAFGTVSIVDGVVTYTPTAGFVGTDSFTYLANDGVGGSTPATVVITVVNLAPVAENFSITMPMNTTETIALAGSDPDGDAITFALISSPINGSVSLVNGVATYTPKPGFYGLDAFSYVTNDGLVDSVPGVVGITVEFVNSPPVALSLEESTFVDTPISFSLEGSDPDGDAFTFSVLSGPSNGVLEVGSNGAVTYTPEEGFEGTDTFTYLTNDGDLDSAVATVVISVIPVPNEPPVAEDLVYTTTPNTAVDIILVGSDLDEDPITYTIVSYPAHGTLSSLVGAFLSYTPDANYSGADAFTYIVNDGQDDSAVATVLIDVDGDGNLPPVVDAGEDALYGLNLIGDELGRAVIPLFGSASDDGLPPDTSFTSLWTLVSAPAGVTVDFVDAGAPESSVLVTNPVTGFYTFRLTADDGVFAVFDEVTIELRILNAPPEVTTKLDQEALGLNVLHEITGTVTDDDFPGNPLSTEWVFVHGPATPTITDPSSVTTTVSFPQVGIYIFELVADDLEYTDGEVLIVYVDLDCLIALPSSAVAWWTGKYSILDFVERRHDGEAFGGLTFTPGMVSLAWYFDGVDDGVYVGRTLKSDIGAGNGFSFEGWVSPDTMSNGTFMQWYDGTSSGIELRMVDTGALEVVLPSATSSSIVPGTSFNTTTTTFTTPGGLPAVSVQVPGVFEEGAFHHVAITYSRTNGYLIVYIDGAVAAYQLLGVHYFKSVGDIWLGTNHDSSSAYNGVLDEWTIYSTAIPSSTVQRIYNSGGIGKCPAPDNL